MTSPQGPAREERWQVSTLGRDAIVWISSADTILVSLGAVADYLNALEAERDAYRLALEDVYDAWVDSDAHNRCAPGDCVKCDATYAAYAEALALSSVGQNAQQGPVEPAEAS